MARRSGTPPFPPTIELGLAMVVGVVGMLLAIVLYRPCGAGVCSSSSSSAVGDSEILKIRSSITKQSKWVVVDKKLKEILLFLCERYKTTDF